MCGGQHDIRDKIACKQINEVNNTQKEVFYFVISYYKMEHRLVFHWPCQGRSCFNLIVYKSVCTVKTWMFFKVCVRIGIIPFQNGGRFYGSILYNVHLFKKNFSEQFYVHEERWAEREYFPTDILHKYVKSQLRCMETMMEKKEKALHHWEEHVQLTRETHFYDKIHKR